MSRFVVVASVLAFAHVAGGAPPADTFRVTCRVPDDPDARVYVLEPSRGGWQLRFTSGATKGATLRLALPGASPEITAGAARLDYHNANGGRQVDLSVGEGPARLDVWVDHGLEVNVDPDLDPRVDLMNTHGPLAGAECAIAPVPAPTP
jgi:hypothetical protein